MNEVHEIAYAVASKRLCLFTGTGFSRAISSDTAPRWNELLIKICESSSNKKRLISTLFPKDESSSPLSPEEKAQVIAIDLRSQGKSIHQIAAELVRNVEVTATSNPIREFLSNRENEFRVITTNYDKLLESLVGKDRSHTIAPGLPIPRSSRSVEVLHIHGSIDSPENMVLTSDDYFKFMNGNTYFSKKLSTLLHENTVLILGYSLNDTNLKALFNDHSDFSRQHIVGSSAIFVSKDKVSQHVKDYYAQSFGIRVLDSMPIESLFRALNALVVGARQRLITSVESISKILNEDHIFIDSYLKVESSFFDAISSLGAIGKSFDDPKVVALIGNVIDRKVKFTRETGAWLQYEHLSAWLIHLASLISIRGTTIEGRFLDAVCHSMGNMSKENKMGYSWKSYKTWEMGWDRIIASNRELIRTYIEKKIARQDILLLVNELH